MVTSAIKYPMALTLCLVILGCPPVISTTVTVHPNPTTIEVGQTVQLTAASTSAADTGFDWESSDPAVAVVSASGLVTGLADGAAWITATGQGSGAQATAVVTVLPPITVTVTPDPASIEVGQVVQLTATSTDASDYGFGWSSSNPAIAAVNATGLVTGVAEGSVEITATGQGSGVSGTASVTVTQSLTVVTIFPSPVAVEVGKTVQVGATSNSATDTDVYWWAQNLGVVEVSATGLVTGISVGSVEISATAEPSGATATVVANVSPASSVEEGSPAWQRVFGGTGTDEAYGVAVTPDGGCVVAGFTYVSGFSFSDMYLIKLDSAGNQQWSRTYGGDFSDEAHAIAVTPDGGYVLAGYTESFGAGGLDIYLVKLNSLGDVQWTRTYGSPYDDEEANSVVVTPDGGYVLAGYKGRNALGRRDMYVVKVDGMGNEQWSHTHGGDLYDEAWGVTLAPDGGYAIIGEGYLSTLKRIDIYLLKLSATGTVEWTRTYGGSGLDEGRSIMVAPDGGYLFAGTWANQGWYSSESMGYLAKVDAVGNGEWSRTYPNAGLRAIVEMPGVRYGLAGTAMTLDMVDAEGEELWWASYRGEDFRVANGIAATSDGACILAGSTHSAEAGWDVFIVKVYPPETEGDSEDWDGMSQGGTSDIFEWWRTYGGAAQEEGRSVVGTPDGACVVAGYTTDPHGAGSHDVYVVKLDEFGSKLWSRTYGGAGYDDAQDLATTPDGGYLIAGYTESFCTGFGDMSLLKIDAMGNQVWWRTFGGTGQEIAYGISATPDGGCVLAGTIRPEGPIYGEQAAYIVKVDAAGDEQWSRTYGGGSKEFLDVVATPDGGCLAVGSTTLFDTSYTDVYVVRLNAMGQLEWSQTYGYGHYDTAWSVTLASDSGYVLAGRTKSLPPYGSSWDAYVLKIDAAGTQQWARRFNGLQNDWVYAVATTSDGGYVLAGEAEDTDTLTVNAYFLKLDSVGNEVWSRTSVSPLKDGVYGVAVSPDGGYIFGGYATSSAEDSDIYVLKVNDETETTSR
ncbi:MAG: Ig-like domain-containing protein [Candidatus Hydrogenedentes bacterium]|nr:Ig-like domain-containing protein [Candidatus Hydrogenedentota bacterium]